MLGEGSAVPQTFASTGTPLPAGRSIPPPRYGDTPSQNYPRAEMELPDVAVREVFLLNDPLYSLIVSCLYYRSVPF